jgi:hypothetical protein
MEAGIRVPVRADGTPRVFFYDPHGGHIIRRCPDGSYEALGWDCRHPVRQVDIGDD